MRHRRAGTSGRERVLHALYGAAMGTRPWPEALDRLAQYTSTRFVSLDSYDMNQKVGAVLASNMARDNPVLAEYSRVNGTRNHLLEKAFPHQYRGAILRSSRILPARKFVETDIYHSLFKPLGMKHAAGITMDIGAGSMTHYSFIKPYDAPDFTDRELDILRDLQPDLTQVWLGFQHLSGLQAQLDTLTTLWDRFDHPVVVTNKQRRVRFANRAAERLFESSSLFVSRLGKLRGAGPGVEARLQQAFSQLDDDRRQIISLTPQTAGKADRPMATLFRMSSNRVALVISHPSASSADFRPMLRQCYQMTASEADVVQFILSGYSLRDYCNSHRATYETARTHLKNAMKKNDWRRQGEMIAAVLSALLPPSLFSNDRPQAPEDEPQ